MSGILRFQLGRPLLWLGGLSLAAVLLLPPFLATEVGRTLTLNTIRLSLVWYSAALTLMARLDADGWAAETARGRAARWCWTWGVAIFWVHVALAFHYYHDWSHARAYQRVREASGAGEGVFVSYVFQVLWAADAAYWWRRPHAYAARSPAIGKTLHTFMLFIVFNGTVVFESGPIRWVSAAAFVALAGWWQTSAQGRHEHDGQAKSIDAPAA